MSADRPLTTYERGELLRKLERFENDKARAEGQIAVLDQIDPLGEAGFDARRAELEQDARDAERLAGNVRQLLARDEATS